MRVALLYLPAVVLSGMLFMSPALDMGRTSRVGGILLLGTISLMLVHAVWGTVRARRNRNEAHSPRI